MKTYLLTLIAIIMATTSVKAQDPIQVNFESESDLNQWKKLEIDGWSSKIRSLKIKNGNLIFEPTSSGWFEDNYAGFLYQEFEGNFELSTKVKTEGTNNSLPQKPFSLAGLFIRVPREVEASSWERGKENWMFFSIGSATEPGKPQFEIKSTYKSQSTLKIYPAKEGWVQLKIVRVSEIFSLFHKFEGESEWKLLDQFIRPDLPETLQIGITAYADWPSVAEVYPNYEEYNVNGTSEDEGDLVAHFDYVSIESGRVKKELPIANFIGNQILAVLNNDN